MVNQVSSVFFENSQLRIGAFSELGNLVEEETRRSQNQENNFSRRSKNHFLIPLPFQ
jgi:hypothetical protein